MNTRNVAAEYRLAHWGQVLQERADRSISIRLYCEEAGIHENTYFYWQRKLREAACTGIQPTGLSDGKSLVPRGWTALSVKEPNQAHELTVEVVGCHISVQADTDLELLTKVCRALRTI